MTSFPTSVPAPTSRSYSPGTYPQVEFEAQNGVKTVIRYGKNRINATLSLGFNNITDSQAASILSNYETVNSVWGNVTFDGTNVIDGADSQLQTFFKEGTPLKWRYSGPPSVTSVYPGISNVSCSFVACLDAPI
tara:strand:+ start:5543 stop:5944 length:402 start_codon:yes stop_codon:yes gene_type:complete